MEKERLLNTSIEEVANLFKQYKEEGFTLEEIEKLIFG